MSRFFTIRSPSEGLYKEKGSKFLSFSFSVNTEEEVKIKLAEVRKRYHDARHHCYAWNIGIEDQSWRVNDDGEPSHTAGDPILGQIRSFELTNVLVIVVRYFGGTKLGRAGLVNAYKEAAEEALNKVSKQEVFEVLKISLNFGYDDLSTVERLIEDYEIEVIERRYTTTCQVYGRIKKELSSKIKVDLNNNYQVKVSFE